MKRIICPCCGKTLVDEYEICDVCDWENDPVQLAKPDYAGGANKMSLNEERKAYMRCQHAKKDIAESDFSCYNDNKK